MSSEPRTEWLGVDAGWGRAAVEFATLSELGNCREYVSMHQHLDVGAGDRLLDIACGAGLAIELAAVRGAACAGIDASQRLIAVARDRNPDHDIRVGDMHALPWEDESFDIVTSFRGIWGTTPDALDEVRRVLAPGGRLGLTVWGHLKPSPGSWAMAPFRLAAAPKVANQAAMVSLGRPGAGEALLEQMGFVDIERIEVPFVWEFADPNAYARALASLGPSHEAIENVGEEAFIAAAIDIAEGQVRAGLPLRAELPVVGYVARRPERRASVPVDERATAIAPTGYIEQADAADAVTAQFLEECAKNVGFVMNTARVWARLHTQHDQLFALLDDLARTAGLSFRQRGILVVACAAQLGDSYCSLAWGRKLTVHSGQDTPLSLLSGDDAALSEHERTLARWARQVARDPNATTAADVRPLRDAGYDDTQILAITMFVGLRIAFSSINDALGIQPDPEFDDGSAVSTAVTFGRRIATCH